MKNWTESVKVEEENLQKYLCQKQHTVVLQGAVHTLKHTLVPVPTTNADGFLHFGDMLMLQNACTRGLLQVDAMETTVDTGSAEVTGYGLSTGSVISSYPRTNFTICRVDDNDRFGTDDRIHFGQLIRLGTHEALHERPHYLFAAASRSKEEGQISICPRAAPGSHWRVCKVNAQSGNDSREEEEPSHIKLGEPLSLENVVTGCELQSNSQVVMTSYGNEYKVFGATGHVPGGQADRGKTNQWAFVDEHWSERMIDAAKEKDGLEISKGGAVYKADPVAMLTDPMYRAEAQLAHLDVHGAGEDRYAVLSRIYPILRSRDMHTIRRLRRMCAASDEKGTGIISTHIFHGLLSWVCIRLTREESQQLQALFGCDEAGNPTDQSSDLINYHRFIRLMGANMSNFRLEVVKDAWRKLEDSAIAAMVDITHLQRYFCPEAFPKAKDGSMSRDEAREEFLRQWELDHPEGRITWEAFKAYYEDVSLAMEDDELFVELVRKSWKL